MAMKKFIVLSLVAVLSLISFAPAFAREDEDRGGGKERSEIKKELKKESKEEKKELKELEKMLRFAPKAMTLTGRLVSVNTSVSTTEITVLVAKVWPSRPKRLSTSTVSYPEAGKEVVIKVPGKAKLIRAYGAKMSVADLSVGDQLHITAKFNKDGSVEARVIRDNSLHMLQNQKGVVESIDAAGLSFVLKQEKRILTIKTDVKTKFKMRGVTSTSFADLKVGDKVMVKGIINTNLKVVTAHSVVIQKPKAVPVPGPTPTSTPPAPTSTPPATSTTST